MPLLQPASTLPANASTPSPHVGTSNAPANQHLPLVLHAPSPDADLAAWLTRDADAIGARLLHHGAVLFRGFAVASTSEFQHCAESLCPDLFDEYGDLPRQSSADKVYDSTPYPADKRILFHHEASHTGCWPLKQWFYCVTPAQKGGRTPLVDSRTVLGLLDAAVVEEFHRRRITYIRNFTPGLDVSWQAFFKTADREAVERECRAQGFDCTWKTGDRLQIRRTCGAIVRHAKTGERLFFNQIQLHHSSCLPPQTRESLLSLFGEADLPRQVYFGDGTAIPDTIVDHVRAVYDRAAAGFDWRQHDVLLVDNMLVAHGRDPFVGPRKIAVAMGEMIRSEQLPLA